MSLSVTEPWLSTCSHCVSTVSPPGAAFPPGIQLPHVAAPPGGDSLPPGEGCYNCDTDSDGIPLSRPLNSRPLSLRSKRDIGSVLSHGDNIITVGLRTHVEAAQVWISFSLPYPLSDPGRGVTSICTFPPLHHIFHSSQLFCKLSQVDKEALWHTESPICLSTYIVPRPSGVNTSFTLQHNINPTGTHTSSR